MTSIILHFFYDLKPPCKNNNKQLLLILVLLRNFEAVKNQCYSISVTYFYKKNSGNTVITFAEKQDHAINVAFSRISPNLPQHFSSKKLKERLKISCLFLILFDVYKIAVIMVKP